MIAGAHFLLDSKDPEADRAFLRDVLGFRSVDAGHGWLIFQLPPAELALHADLFKSTSNEKLSGAVLYLMCDDLDSTVAWLKSRKVQCGSISNERWGIRTTVPLPSGGQIGLYQPKHPRAIDLR